MYTPRQSSSLNPTQSSLDPGTGIRVVIQPSQSSYFAGEPFSCTVTFTNTRRAVPSSRVRSRSVSFNPGHKRAAHSISSAPLARPPTSPGTPKTAQPFLAFQNREGDAEATVSRKGLIGKPATAAAAVLEKKRRNMTRSLSVDVTPQDIIKRLADQSAPHSPPTPLPPKRSSPTSPPVSSPLARERVNLPSSHPHARKHSVVSDDMTSQPMSYLGPSPTTPLSTSGSSFQLSLDPIKENGINHHSPTLSENPSSPDVIQPPSLLPQSPHGRLPSSLGLGLPLAVPSITRAKSTGHPPHTAFSTSFSLPSTELLLYAYAQLSGTLNVDPAFMPASSEFFDLRNALRLKAAVGGGSLDIASGTHRHRASSGFFGFLSSSNITNNVASKGSVPGGITTPASAIGEDGDESIPTLETQASMLAIDLTLAAGESRSYSYTLDLPANLPPTFKGRALRFSYQLVVGTCRASTPFVSASSPGLLPQRVSSPAISGDFERRLSRVMRVPIRVYNHVAVGHAPRPYDLLWPVARRQEKMAIGRVDEVKDDKSVAKLAKRAGSLTTVQSYASHLLSGEGKLELEAPTDELGDDGGAMSGCREAVEITTRNPKKVSYDVNQNGDRVAVLTFVKSAYRLGETVLGVVELNEGHCRSKVLKLSAMLEAHESLPWPGGPVRRVHAEHHSSLVSDMRRVSFALDIPSDASPAFEVGQGLNGRAGGLEWKVRLCLLVSVATGSGSAKGKGRAVEVRGLIRDGPAGEWGMSWRAPETLAPMERVRAPPPESLAIKASSSSWTAAILNAFASATYHDADEQEDNDEADDGEWAEMSAETVECLVPIRVFAGNTAFRAMEIMFEV